MFSFLAILAIVWIVAPIVLLILFICAQCGKNDYKNKYKNMCNENSKLLDELNKYRANTASSPPVASTVKPLEASDGQVAVSTATPTVTSLETASEPAQAVPPVNKSAESEAERFERYKKNAAGYNFSYENPVESPVKPLNTPKSAEMETRQAPIGNFAENTQPEPKKDNVSTINILFILGALFIIVAGLIFSTTTWQFLSDGVKAIVILSFSALFFGASSLAERKFKLEKTGMLLYTLGSVFLPITLVAAGYFEVFGEWFSLSGDGRSVYIAMIFALFSGVCVKGSVDYRENTASGVIYAWAGLLSFSAAVCALISQFSSDVTVFSLVASIYSLAVLIVCGKLSDTLTDRLKAVVSQLNSFAVINTVILSLSCFAAPVISDGSSIIGLISCVIFSIGYLRGSFTDKSAYAGVVQFTIFSSLGIICLLNPRCFEAISYTAVAIALIPTVLSLMNLIPENIRVAMKPISIVCGIAALCICFISIASAEPSWVKLVSCAVLSADMLIFGLRQDNSIGKVMLGIFPIAFTELALILSRLLTDDSTTVTALVFISIVLLYQLAVSIFGKLGLRSLAGDITITAAAIIAELIALIFSNFEHGEFTYITENIIVIICCVLATGTALIPVIFKKYSKERVWMVGAAFAAFTPIAAPLVKITALNGMSVDDRAFIFMLAIFIVMSVVSMIMTRYSLKRDGDGQIAVAGVLMSRIIGLIYFCIVLSYGNDSPTFAFPMIATVCCFLLSAMKKSKSDHIFGLLGLTLTALMSSINFYSGDKVYVHFMWAAIAAVVIYLVNELANRGNDERHIMYDVTDVIARILLSAFTTVMTVIISVYAFDSDFTADMLIVIPFILLAIIQSYTTKNTLPSIPVVAAALLLITALTEDYPTEITALIWVLSLATIVLGYYTHRKAIYDSSEKNVYFDLFVYARFVGALILFAAFDSKYVSWSGWLMLGISVLSMIKAEQSSEKKRFIATIAMLSPVAAIQLQPFFDVPRIISLEYKIVPVLIYCGMLQLLWKDKKETVDKLSFVVYAVSYVILFIAALMSEKIEDAMIIVISSLMLLVYSFIVKKKKWFVLSVSILVISALIMSKIFWKSIAWWVYLLAAGALLIIIGAANELKKQSTNSEFSEKLSRFMSEWTW